jgi:hypothetical protein
MQFCHTVSVLLGADSEARRGVGIAVGVLVLLVALATLAVALRAGHFAAQNRQQARNSQRHGTTSANLIRLTAGFCALVLGATALRLLLG